MRKKSMIIADARKAIDIGGDSPEIAEWLDEVRAELDELQVQEAATEAAIQGAPVVSNLPLYMVTLAQDITTIPPGQVQANRVTRTLPAVMIVRPDDEARVKGVDSGITVEDLLPKDLGLRVFGNWRILEVQKCEAVETEIPEPEA